jgi:hypothetical protein
MTVSKQKHELDALFQQLEQIKQKYIYLYKHLHSSNNLDFLIK